MKLIVLELSIYLPSMPSNAASLETMCTWTGELHDTENGGGVILADSLPFPSPAVPEKNTVDIVLAFMEITFW